MSHAPQEVLITHLGRHAACCPDCPQAASNIAAAVSCCPGRGEGPDAPVALPMTLGSLGELQDPVF